MAIDLFETNVKVLIVYPGLVDTELFSIPGNDPVPSDMEPIPVAELVTDVRATFASWQKGTVVRSWLLDLAVRALDEDQHLTQLRGFAQDGYQRAAHALVQARPRERQHGRLRHVFGGAALTSPSP